MERVNPSKFISGGFVLLAHEEFHAGENFFLHWRGPRCVLSNINDYLYIVEDLRNGQLT